MLDIFRGRLGEKVITDEAQCGLAREANMLDDTTKIEKRPIVARGNVRQNFAILVPKGPLSDAGAVFFQEPARPSPDKSFPRMGSVTKDKSP
jgi:hypothetical protein